NSRINEVSNRKNTTVHRKRNRGEIRLADDRGDERSQKVFGECSHHSGKCSANHHADGHVHYVSAQNELLESTEHKTLLNRSGRYSMLAGAERQADLRTKCQPDMCGTRRQSWLPAPSPLYRHARFAGAR